MTLARKPLQRQCRLRQGSQRICPKIGPNRREKVTAAAAIARACANGCSTAAQRRWPTTKCSNTCCSPPAARADTKPTAKALLARFGSLAGVLNADYNALAEVDGMGEVSAAALKAVALAARRMARSEVRQKPVLGSWQALLDYLAIDMAHLTIERVRVLYLDARNRLILDHMAQEGTIDEAAIHPREVVKKALEVGATALILVHNHPSGNPEPSRADIQITARIAEAGRLLGITVHDHVIVGREGHVSLKAKGLIRPIDPPQVVGAIPCRA